MTYAPETIALREEGGTLVIVDVENDAQENAILLTLGHPQTDLPDGMIREFAERLVQMYNNERRLNEGS